MSTGYEPLRSQRVHEIRSAGALLSDLMRWNPDIQSAVVIDDGRVAASSAAGEAVLHAAELMAASATGFFGATARLGLEGVRVTTIDGDEGHAVIARVDERCMVVVVAAPGAPRAALRADVEWLAARLVRPALRRES
jgi:predicted regulator of Ras-like GTPase activity (Roadblock/LC7/MglB family)